MNSPGESDKKQTKPTASQLAGIIGAHLRNPWLDPAAPSPFLRLLREEFFHLLRQIGSRAR